MKIGIAIFELLSSNAGVAAIVDNRIFPSIAAKNAALPFVTYDVINVTPNDDKSGAALVDEIDVEIIGHAATYTQAAQLGDAVRAALDRQSITVGDVVVDSIQFQTADTAMTDAPRKMMNIAEFKVRQKRTV